MLNLAVLVSGGGTNLQAVIDAIGSGQIRNARIVKVISSKDGVKALARAEDAGIDTLVISAKDYKGADEYGRALADAIDEAGADLIVLAGFLTILSPEFTDRYENRIINIHPSLIPSFCGPGYYGLKVHEEALKRGVKVTGATVHFVDGGCDSGPIILQKAVGIREGDTPEILQKRVMEEAEWKILPEAINLIAEGRVRVSEGVAHISKGGEK